MKDMKGFQQVYSVFQLCLENNDVLLSLEMFITRVGSGRTVVIFYDHSSAIKSIYCKTVEHITEFSTYIIKSENCWIFPRSSFNNAAKLESSELRRLMLSTKLTQELSSSFLWSGIRMPIISLPCTSKLVFNNVELLNYDPKDKNRCWSHKLNMYKMHVFSRPVRLLER